MGEAAAETEAGETKGEKMIRSLEEATQKDLVRSGCG